MWVVRAAAKRASAKFKSAHPFASAQIKTDGRSIFDDRIIESVPEIEKHRIGSRLLEDLKNGQMVFHDFAEPYLDQKFTLNLRQFWPLDRGRRVVIDPLRSYGRPIDPESGILTSTLYRTYEAEHDVDSVANWFMVDADAVRDAIQFETELKDKPALRMAA